MEIIKTNITVRDLCKGYQNDTETNVEHGVYAYVIRNRRMQLLILR